MLYRLPFVKASLAVRNIGALPNMLCFALMFAYMLESFSTFSFASLASLTFAFRLSIRFPHFSLHFTEKLSLSLRLPFGLALSVPSKLSLWLHLSVPSSFAFGSGFPIIGSLWFRFAGKPFCVRLPRFPQLSSHHTYVCVVRLRLT